MEKQEKASYQRLLNTIYKILNKGLNFIFHFDIVIKKWRNMFEKELQFWLRQISFKTRLHTKSMRPCLLNSFSLPEFNSFPNGALR